MAQPTSPQRFSAGAPGSRARHCAAPDGEPHKLLIHFDLLLPLLQDPTESHRYQCRRANVEIHHRSTSLSSARSQRASARTYTKQNLAVKKISTTLS